MLEIYLLGTRMFMIMEVNESFSFEKKAKADQQTYSSHTRWRMTPGKGTSRRDYLKLMAAGAGLAATAPVSWAQKAANKTMAEDPQTPPPDHDRRIQWWQEAKFGMFIHWGLYSVIGRHEWAMEMEGIPIPQYEMLAKHFNPKPNAAREWAKLASKRDRNTWS